MTAQRHGPWAVLDTDPTQDARQIKRAYAARLKVVRPDDDAAGFQALREAYEWAIAQCDDTPAAPVVHLEPATPDVVPAQAPAVEPPDFSPRRPQPLTFRTAPPADSGPAPAELGLQQWRAFLAEVPPQDPEDLADTRVETIETLLRARLQHPDLISFEARDTFEQAALRACADAGTLGTVRMACDNVFEWTFAPMPLDLHARRLWQLAIGRAAGDVQYQSVQDRAKHSAAVRRVLRPGPPEIPTLRLFMPYFLADVRKFLEQLKTKWPQALDYRLNTQAIHAWDEAAGRPWPSFFGLMSLAALSAFGALMFWSSGHRWDAPDWYKSAGDVLMWLMTGSIAVLPVVLRVAWPVWLLPALERRQARGQLRPLHPALWYGIRIAPTLLAFFGTLLPGWYTGVVSVAIVVIALLHVLILVAQRRAKVLAVFFLVGLFYSINLLATYQPFFSNDVLVLALADTVFFGLRDALARGFGLDWHTTRARLILLAAGAALVPAQLLLAQHLPAPAALMGWIWFLAGAAMVDAFWTELAGRQGLGHTFVWFLAMAITVGMGLALSDALSAKGDALRGVLILQGSIGWLAIAALIGSGWRTLRDGVRARRQQA